MSRKKPGGSHSHKGNKSPKIYPRTTNGAESKQRNGITKGEPTPAAESPPVQLSMPSLAEEPAAVNIQMTRLDRETAPVLTFSETETKEPTFDAKDTAAEFKRKRRGLIIFGTESISGKTVVAAGLGGFFLEEGMQLRAIKPIAIASRFARDAELAFLSRVTNTAIDYTATRIDAPGHLSREGWGQAAHICKSTSQFTILEMPGSPATPLMWTENHDRRRPNWLDCADFAAELGWPCLLITRYGFKTVEQLTMSANHLAAKGIEILGMAAVKTTPDFLDHVTPPNFDAMLAEQLNAPFLGTVPYSNSVSVLDQSQGNLIKLISVSLDLLPVSSTIEAVNAVEP